MKKLLAILLATALCVTTTLPVFAGGRDYTDYNDCNLDNVLKDRNEDATELYYEIEANWLNHLELFDGISSATYKPALDAYATREQAMKLMAEAFDWTIDMDALSGFTDVSPWAEPYVAAAVAQNAINGIGNGLFGAQDPITAHEMLAIVVRCLGYSGQDTWDATCDYTERALKLSDYPHMTQDDPITRDYLVGIIFLTLLNGEVKGEDFTLIEKIAMKDEIFEASATNGGLISRNYKRESNGLSQREELIDISPLFTTISTSALPYHSALKHFGNLGYVPLSYTIGTDKTLFEIPESQLEGNNTLILTYRFGQLYFTMKDSHISLKSIRIDEVGHFSYKGLGVEADIATADGIVFNGESSEFDTIIRYYSDKELNAYFNTSRGDGINTLVLSPMAK